MRTGSRFFAIALVAAGISVSGSSVALAQQDCAYVPTSCEEPVEVLPTSGTRFGDEQAGNGDEQVGVGDGQAGVDDEQAGVDDGQTEVDDGQTEVNARSTPAETLPFTGGEIALGVLAGAGAVGAGAALVVAARRRTVSD